MILSHRPASKGKSSKRGGVLVLLVLLAILLSGCFALPTPGSGDVDVSALNTSLAQNRELSGSSRASDLVKRVDGPQASGKDTAKYILAGWSIHTAAMFMSTPDINTLMCRLKDVEADPANLGWHRGSAVYLGQTRKKMNSAWTRTIQNDCDLTNVAQAIHNLRPASPISTVMQSHGGPNICIRWTQDKEYVMSQGPVWLRPKRTDATYRVVVNPESGVIIVLQAEMLKPMWMETYEDDLKKHDIEFRKRKAKGLPARELTAEDIMPRPYSTDQILVHDWRYTTAEALSEASTWSSRFMNQHVQEKMKELSYVVFQAARLETTSTAILKSVLINSCYGASIPSMPGLTWVVGQWQFSALLALPEFRSLAWLLTQYKEVFPNKIITQVTLFKGEGADDNTPSFIWHLGEPTQDISSRSAVFQYLWADTAIKTKLLNQGWLNEDNSMRKLTTLMRNANIKSAAELARKFGISEPEFNLGQLTLSSSRQGGGQSQVQPRTGLQGHDISNTGKGDVEESVKERSRLKGLETITPAYQPASVVRAFDYAENLARAHNPQCIAGDKSQGKASHSQQQQAGSQGGSAGGKSQ